ncbi:TrkH family potassium uptake protein [Pontibacter locisalis]|uniref:TrkH family potassium uptake protein n=1 Tax=Pontibacter locisalis TaxID=1719035 RepID=A0ABW5IP40_9BACT
MNGRLSSFLQDIGKLLHLPAGLTVLTLPVIFYYEEWFALIPFGLMALVSSGIGQLLYLPFKSSSESAVGLSIIFVAISWLMLPLFGIIPFYGTALTAPANAYPAISVFNDPINCFFESMSGFTGTGLTMVNDPTELPYTLQWWRTLMEWIGGIGVIMLASMLLSLNHDEGSLYKAETRNWTIEDAPVTETIKRIWWIYVAYTIASISAFYLAGMRFWEALNHGMTAIGTGGFSVTPKSFTEYSALIKAIATTIMVVGAVNFKTHYLLIFRRDIGSVLKQSQLRYFILLLGIGLLALVLIKPEIPFVDVFFQVASALGTCGLNSANLSLWTMSPLFLLTILMLFGGNAGSTAGGIKTERVAWFSKGVWRGVKQAWLPKDKEATIEFDGERKKPHVTERNIQQAASIYFLWMVALTIGTLLLSVLVGDQFSFDQILFDTASALSNVGLSSGLTGPDLPNGAKFLLTALMWFGRLEIMAVVILLLSPVYLAQKKS